MASKFIIPLSLILFGLIQVTNPVWQDFELEKEAVKNPQRTFEILTDRLEKISSSNLLEKGKIQSLRGKLLLDLGLYQEANTTLYEAEELLLQTDCTLCLAKNHNVLGELFYKINGTEAALSRHQEALQLFRRLNEQEEMAKTLGFIGTMYEKQARYQEAIRIQQQALQLTSEHKGSAITAFLYENLGSIYEDLSLYDSSDYYFSKSLDLNLALNDSTHLPGNYNNLGDIARKTGHFKVALELSSLAMKTSQKLGNLYQEKSALVDISKTYALIGAFDQAYEVLEKARKLDEEIFSLETARQISIQETQHRLIQQRAHISQLEQKTKFDGIIRGLLIFLLILIIGFGYLILNRQKIKIRSGKALLLEQEKNLEIKEKLIATEKENINLLEARMSLEVESQNKALTAQTVHLLEKNQMLEEIRLKLKKTLEVEAKDQKKWIRNLIKQIDYNFSQDTDWEDFKNNFEKVHQDFFKSLSKNDIELTAGEMKLASLMRMNLSSKEISSTLGISPESLRIARYRLRKKLNLQKGESLQHYILCI